MPPNYHSSTPAHPLDMMADSLQYPPASHYVPAAYFTQQHVPGHMHVVNASPRQDTGAQRKRPKYTRSKTGCLTCRAKKIKCDETKPNCVRCTHGQRECTWPEGVPSRKKPLPKREPAPDSGFDTRPSTAGSSGLSEASTPPIRDHTPPKREPIELGLPPMATRRHPESMHMPIMTHDGGAARRQQTLAPITSASGHGYPVHSNSHTHGLPALPEMSASYTSHTQYHHSYSGHQYGHPQSLALPRVTSQHDMHPVRSVEASHSGQWSSPPMLTPVDPIEPFFPTVQERNLVGHPSSNVHHVRYQ